MRALRRSLSVRSANGRAAPDRGFTLLELLITVAVAAVLAAIAVPSFRTVMQNSARDAALNSLSNALNYARNAALRSDAPVSVCPKVATSDACGSDWNNGWIVATRPASASTVVLMTKPALPAGGPKVTAVGGVGSIQFLPSGLVSDKAAFLICDDRGDSAAKALEIYATGYVQVSAEAGQLANGGSATCP